MCSCDDMCTVLPLSESWTQSYIPNLSCMIWPPSVCLLPPSVCLLPPSVCLLPPSVCLTSDTNVIVSTATPSSTLHTVLLVVITALVVVLLVLHIILLLVCRGGKLRRVGSDPLRVVYSCVYKCCGLLLRLHDHLCLLQCWKLLDSVDVYMCILCDCRLMMVQWGMVRTVRFEDYVPTCNIANFKTVWSTGWLFITQCPSWASSTKWWQELYWNVWFTVLWSSTIISGIYCIIIV